MQCVGLRSSKQAIHQLLEQLILLNSRTSAFLVLLGFLEVEPLPGSDEATLEPERSWKLFSLPANVPPAVSDSTAAPSSLLDSAEAFFLKLVGCFSDHMR